MQGLAYVHYFENKKKEITWGVIRIEKIKKKS